MRAPEPPRAGRLRLALAMAMVAALMLGLVMWVTGIAARPEFDTLDARYQSRPAAHVDDVALVAIDDVSFSRFPVGTRQWPWPRSWHARVIDRLKADGAKVIVYDVQFTEASAVAAEDNALLDAVAHARNVVLATTEVDDAGGTNVFGGDEVVREVNAHVGAANLPGDAGDVIRRFPYDNTGLKSLAVVAAEQATGRTITASSFPGHEAWIDYAGPPGTIPTVSFVDVWAGRFPKGTFTGRVVVVGATAPSLQDMHPTPTTDSDTMSGPEVQANAIRTVLHGFRMREVPAWVNVLMIVLLAAVTPLLALRWKLPIALGGALATGAAFAVAGVVAFRTGHIIAMAVPLMTLLAGAAFTTVARYLGESRERRRYAWYTRVLEEKVAERTAELRQAQLEVVERLGQAAEWREAETGRHIERVGRLCEALALEAGIPPKEAEVIRLAAALHDIGKIGIPDAVLLKQGPLDAGEWALMRGHTTIGGDILTGSRSPLLNYAEQIARTHHEHWDGNGYPNGLAGTDIPITGRICAICDVFDALLSKRSYKDAWPLEAVVAEITELAGRQFDPELVTAFGRIAPRLYDDLEYAIVMAADPEATASR